MEGELDRIGNHLQTGGGVAEINQTNMHKDDLRRL